MQSPKSVVSVIVPVYSGRDYLEELALVITMVRKDWSDANYPIEIGELIFVDDGSKDGSADILEKLAEQSWIKVITLSRNYGQHAATAAGISYSAGDWVATIDEDLQHDPQLFLAMLERCVKTSADIVYVKSREGVHKSAFRDLASRAAKTGMAKLTKNPNIQNFSSFRMMRGSIARSMASMSSFDSYLDIVFSWYSSRVETLEVDLVDRRYVNTGNSGYTLRRLLSHARRLIMTSDVKIIRYAATLGALLLTGCLALILYLLAVKVLFPDSILAVGWTSLMLTTLGIGGGIAMVLSIIAEYIAILVQHTHGKPTFSIVDRNGDKALRVFFENLHSVAKAQISTVDGQIEPEQPISEKTLSGDADV